MRSKSQPLIFELSSPGRRGATLPALDVPEADLPQDSLRDDVPLPEIAEIDLVRHYVHLSHKNFAVDATMYPLGSCTMKYNSKMNEVAARLPGFAHTHPLQEPETVQGNMQLMYELQNLLAEIGGFHAVSLQPAAGAQGELSGVLIMRNYLYDRGETQRTKILTPDSAHGTNPASTSMSGLEVVELPSDKDGNLDIEALKSSLDDQVIGLMITNPSTLGLFESNILEVTGLVHEAGGLVYGDGANMNAMLGIAKPAELGVDVLHYNLHKTFSTPHGGGGPGSGPVGVTEELAPYLPGPIVTPGEEGNYAWYMPARSIGRVRSFSGNFGVMVRAYAYIMIHGAGGLRAVSENAVINANYLQERLRDHYPIPFGHRRCMHEFVAQGKLEGAPDVRTMDIAKRLIDFGFHPPTVYFPLIVAEALMIEPTETESRETLDAFADALIEIANEARRDPELLHTAPHNAPRSRLDEVRAARELKLCATV